MPIVFRHLRGSPPFVVQIQCESGDQCGGILELEKQSDNSIRFAVLRGMVGGSVVVERATLDKAIRMLRIKDFQEFKKRVSKK